MREVIISIFQFIPYEIKLLRLLLKPFVFIFKLNKRFIQVNYKNIKFILYPSNSHHQTGIALYPRIIEKKMIDTILSKIKKKGVFIDLGSHSGFYALVIYSNSNKVLSSYAFEADPQSCQRIKKNIFLNKFQEHIKVINKAVSGSEFNFSLKINTKNRGSNVVRRTKSKKKNKTIKLSSWFNIKIKRKISAIKLDIEGHEPGVLDDIFHNIDKKFWPDVIVVEINPFFNQASNIRKILKENKYLLIKKENQNYAYIKK